MTILLEKEAEDLLAKEGFNVIDRASIKNKENLREININFPWAMKIVSKKIVHKAKAGGVILNIKNQVSAEKALDRLKLLPGFDGVIIQPMAEPGEKMIIGLKKTPEFGMTIIVGAGGTKVEEMKDVSFRVCPINENDAESMIKDLRIYGTIKSRININILKKNLLNMSKLAEKRRDIAELDINPIIINKKEAVIVDARISFD